MLKSKIGRPRAGFGYTSDVPAGRVQSRRADKPGTAKTKPARVASRKGAASAPRPGKSRR